MRNSVGALATVLAILILAPGFTLAGQDVQSKKYGIELQLGGGYIVMGDVNDFIPDAGFLDTRFQGSDEDNIFLGTQFGIGMTYRNMKNFGWAFGYNRFVSGLPVIWESKYRRNAYYIPGSESWVEQSITGSELYIQSTWYWPWKHREIMFGVGPALYSATLDRSISIIRSAGSGANPAGSFADANGKSLGLLVTGGVEFPMMNNFYLTVQGGFRLANIAKLSYEDEQNVEHTIYKNSTSNATFGADFSGVFIKASIRTYFKPSGNWRDPNK